MLGVVVWNSVLQTAARVRGDGNLLQEFHRRGIESRRIDAVVRESGGGRKYDLPAATRRRGDTGEVAIQHGLSRHEADRLRRVALLDSSLVTAEEKHFVLHQRAADSSPELVPLQAVALRSKEVTRVEPVVPNEVEDAAIEGVRARLGHDVDCRCGVMPIPRRQRARLDLELLNGIGKRRRQVQVVERVVVGPAVHDVRHPVGLPAGYRDRDGRIVLVGVEVTGGSGRGQTGQEDQFRRLPAVQRNLHHALVVDYLTHAG